MYGNLQTFPRSTAKPMTDRRKSIFLLHLSRESVCVMMTGTGAQLELVLLVLLVVLLVLLVYPGSGDPWAADVDSCACMAWARCRDPVHSPVCVKLGRLAVWPGFKGRETGCRPVSPWSGRSCWWCWWWWWRRGVDAATT